MVYKQDEAVKRQMSVEICVSSEELKKTLEYMALIGAAGLKKKDADETAGAMRITAVSPKSDYRYMLMFCRMGAAEQLVYRMEGKSRNSMLTASALLL